MQEIKDFIKMMEATHINKDGDIIITNFNLTQQDIVDTSEYQAMKATVTTCVRGCIDGIGRDGTACIECKKTA